MSEDVKQVGTQFAKDYLTSVQNQATGTKAVKIRM